MLTKQSGNDGFVMVPRRFRDDYINRKLTKNQFDVLVWIWLGANPVNGFFSTSYEGLVQDSRETISYDNMRKIISDLRTLHYIAFLSHKGRTGSFAIYPVDFTRTNKAVQTIEYLMTMGIITTLSQPRIKQDIKPDNNNPPSNHNLGNENNTVTRAFVNESRSYTITPPYTETEIETNSNPPGKALEGKEINEIMDLFKEVNPSYERLFKISTQRSALARLLEKMGREKLEDVIKYAAAANRMPYAPTITTPYELERDLGKLLAFYHKEKEKGRGTKIVSIL